MSCIATKPVLEASTCLQLTRPLTVHKTLCTCCRALLARLLALPICKCTVSAQIPDECSRTRIRHPPPMHAQHTTPALPKQRTVSQDPLTGSFRQHPPVDHKKPRPDARCLPCQHSRRLNGSAPWPASACMRGRRPPRQRCPSDLDPGQDPAADVHPCSMGPRQWLSNARPACR